MTAAQDTMALDTERGGAGELIAAGNQLLQIRTRNQLLVAVQRPRDEKVFAARLMQEAAEAGEDFFYSIPYKDHVPGCQDRRRCNCPSKPVEGPGVGLARSAARLWGNCSVDTTLEQDLEDCWLVGAWFIDFETNYTKHEVKRVSKMKPAKGGRMVRAADRELDVVYQQGASKVERDVILRALPRHHLERATELAMYTARTSKVPIKEQLARILRGFVQVEVTLGQLERYLGGLVGHERVEFTEAGLQSMASRDPRDTCAHLVGLLAAIRGGDREAEEVFGSATVAAVLPPSGAGQAAVTLDDLGGTGSVGDEARAREMPRPPDAPVGGGVPPDSAGQDPWWEGKGREAAVPGQAPVTGATPAAATSKGPRGEWGEFIDLLTRAAVHGMLVAKEAPKGSGRWFLTNTECAADLGCGEGVKLWDNGNVENPALLGRVTAWVKARLQA
jgi:hypothetical protein